MVKDIKKKNFQNCAHIYLLPTSYIVLTIKEKVANKLYCSHNQGKGDKQHNLNHNLKDNLNDNLYP
jgi:hypothetical protein